MHHRVGAFQRGNDSLQTRQQLERLHDLVVAGVGKIDPLLIAVVGVLRPDRRIVESGAHRVRKFNLPVGILEDVGLGALEDTELSALKSRRMFAAANPTSARFDPDQPHRFLLEKIKEKSDRI